MLDRSIIFSVGEYVRVMVGEVAGNIDHWAVFWFETHLWERVFSEPHENPLTSYGVHYENKPQYRLMVSNTILIQLVSSWHC